VGKIFDVDLSVTGDHHGVVISGQSKIGQYIGKCSGPNDDAGPAGQTFRQLLSNVRAIIGCDNVEAQPGGEVHDGPADVATTNYEDGGRGHVGLQINRDFASTNAGITSTRINESVVEESGTAIGQTIDGLFGHSGFHLSATDRTDSSTVVNNQHFGTSSSGN